MKNIAVVGAGGFGREVKVLIDAINVQNKIYNFIGFYDDAIPKGTIINGFPILGKVEDLNHIADNLSVALGIGDPEKKRKIVELVHNSKITYDNLIHPSTIISTDEVSIGMGVIICANCIVTCNISIGDFVTLNLMCTIGHDAIIKNYSSFMPSVNISGGVMIESGVYVGTGANIINQLVIGANSIVGAGAVVCNSLPDNCTAVGMPAKPIKFHNL